LKVYLLEEVIAHALSKAPLPIEQKTMRGSRLAMRLCADEQEVAQRALDAFGQLLSDPHPKVKKLAIQCFTDAYPLLFRHS
jgi:hypothetical protein